MTRQEKEELWLDYCGVILPSYAKECKWAVHEGHCFMRIILDNIFQGHWIEYVAKPAYKNMPENDLDRAIFLCKTIIRKPRILKRLNDLSLAYRSKI